MVLVYSILLFLNTYGLIVIAKIVFLNKQTSICRLKYELRGFYNFTLRNIAIGQYHIQKTNENNAFIQKWGISVEQKWSLNKKKRGHFFFRFSTLKLAKKMFSASTSFQKSFRCWPE